MGLKMAIDLGSDKICALIGSFEGSDKPKILGVGHSESKGIRRGIIINIDRAAECVVKAVKEARLMAGCEVFEISASIAGEHIHATSSHGVVAVKRADSEITDMDIQRAIKSASTLSIPRVREILHIIPQEFMVDDHPGIKDPKGMSGVRLEVDVHIVTCPAASIQNVYKTMEKAGLSVRNVIFSPLASANAILDEDERELGIALIDLGGGTTDLTVFVEDSIRHSCSIGLGGVNITRGIASTILTPSAKAEELKIKHGACTKTGPAQTATISIPGVGGQNNRKITQETLASIIESRMQEIFERVLQEIRSKNLFDLLGAGVVLTGGGSHLRGALEIAENIFNLPVKQGIPLLSQGLVDLASSPEHSVAVGLLQNASPSEMELKTRAIMTRNLQGQAGLMQRTVQGVQYFIRRVRGAW